MQTPWNYHSHVKACATCEGAGRIPSQRRASTWDPYPETACPDCEGEHEPECAVCGYNLPVAGYDCLVCDTVAALHQHELKAFDRVAFANAVAVAVRKALADSVKVAA